jgi:hypothetical protein
LAEQLACRGGKLRPFTPTGKEADNQKKYVKIIFFCIWFFYISMAESQNKLNDIKGK